MKISVEFVQLDDVDCCDNEVNFPTNIQIEVPDDIQQWSKEELASLYAKAALLDEGFIVSADYIIQIEEIK